MSDAIEAVSETTKSQGSQQQNMTYDQLTAQYGVNKTNEQIDESLVKSSMQNGPSASSEINKTYQSELQSLADSTDDGTLDNQKL